MTDVKTPEGRKALRELCASISKEWVPETDNEHQHHATPAPDESARSGLHRFSKWRSEMSIYAQIPEYQRAYYPSNTGGFVCPCWIHPHFWRAA